MQVKKLWNRINSQIFVWAGEEPLTLLYDALTFVVPPRFETAKPGIGSIYRLESARNGSGALIPGTIVVADIDTATDTGGSKKEFDVQAMCQYLTRDRDDLFQRGFNIVSTVEEVSIAMEQGIPLYEASQDQRARDILAAELDRQKRFEEKGQPAPPSSSDHHIHWAIRHLKGRAALKATHSPADLRSILEGRYAAEAPPATVRLPVKYSGASLYDEAKSLDIVLNKTELQAILEGDEEQMGFVRAKIQARRERNMEERAAKDAAAAG